MDDNTLLWVACYNRYDNLAHAPKGSPNEHSIQSVRLNEKNGKLTAASAVDGLNNAAFIRHHPNKNIIYVCTESIKEHGEIVGFEYSGTGALTQISAQSAHGASTCYITMAPDVSHLLFVNYWDSTLGCMPINDEGRMEPACSVLAAAGGVVAARDIADHLANRQSEPHAHAVVLDPIFGQIALVPDLGTDEIRQYVFDAERGTLTPAGKLRCAPAEEGPHGPRYIEFDPVADAAYVVNELSSTVSLFRFDRTAAASLADAVLHGGGEAPADAAAVLHFVGLVSTRVSPPPATKNTCGRIAVDPSGQFVLVSNRGDDTLSSFKIVRAGKEVTALQPLQITSTRGATPRHFQFSPTGKYVIAANQDTNNLAVFRLDADSGALEFTGHELACNSPNFICARPSLAALELGIVLRTPVPASKSSEML